MLAGPLNPKASGNITAKSHPKNNVFVTANQKNRLPYKSHTRRSRQGSDCGHPIFS